MLTRDEVIWGYRYVLGRDPEDEAILQSSSIAMRDVDEFRSALLRSREFARHFTRFQQSQWVAAPVFNGRRLMWLDLSDSFVSLGCLGDDYEPTESIFILSILRPTDVFVDVGANVGWFTLLATLKIREGGAVLAFEPKQPTVDYLRKSIELNGLSSLVTVYDAGLSNESGREFLMWCPDSPNGGSASFTVGERPHGMTSHQIVVRRLDSVGLNRVDVLKIDVEGAEHLAILGAQRTIEESRPVVLSEILPSQLERVSRCSAQTYFDFFLSRGYRSFLVHHARVAQEVDGWPSGWTDPLVNVAFVPKERVEEILEKWEKGRVSNPAGIPESFKE